MNMVGRCYENGWGVAPDPVIAVSWYRKAAKAGDSWAQYNLGHMLLDGNGVAMDRAEAFFWYSKAAGQGHPRAMNLVARCHELGWGVERDLEAARRWYRASAEGGYFRGQYNWATILAAEGRVAEARAWFAKAAEQGASRLPRLAA
jgi:TPR repeat protein